MMQVNDLVIIYNVHGYSLPHQVINQGRLTKVTLLKVLLQPPCLLRRGSGLESCLPFLKTKVLFYTVTISTGKHYETNRATSPGGSSSEGARG